MKFSLWIFMIAASGFLIGTAMVSFVTQRANEITIVFVILGIILGFIGFWGRRKYADEGSVSEK